MVFNRCTADQSAPLSPAPFRSALIFSALCCLILFCSFLFDFALLIAVVLCSAVLSSAQLFCFVMCSVLSGYAQPSAALCSPVLICSVLLCPALLRPAMPYSVLHRPIPFCLAQLCSVSSSAPFCSDGASALLLSLFGSIRPGEVTEAAPAGHQSGLLSSSIAFGFDHCFYRVWLPCRSGPQMGCDSSETASAGPGRAVGPHWWSARRPVSFSGPERGPTTPQWQPAILWRDNQTELFSQPQHCLCLHCSVCALSKQGGLPGGRRIRRHNRRHRTQRHSQRAAHIRGMSLQALSTYCAELSVDC